MPPRERQRPKASGALTPHPEPLMPASTSTGPESATAGPADLVYLSARVPKALRTALQHQAVHEGRPVAKLLADAVTAYLETHTRT